MRATGIVRKIDDLGRIVIPKELRRTLKIQENDPLKIFIEDKYIAIKKNTLNETESIGIVRRMDELGRIVIPKELRKTLKIRENNPLEIFVEDNTILFRKYDIVDKELNDYAEDLAKAIQKTTGKSVLITNKNNIIAASKYSNIFKNKKISMKIFDKIKNNVSLENDKAKLVSLYNDDKHKYKSQIIVPIITFGEVIGSVILYSEDSLLEEKDLVATEIAANFLGKQMEG